MLESVLFMQNSSGSNSYELTEGTPGSREFTLRVPENTNVVYVSPQLRDDIFSTAVITARFTDVNTGEEVALEPVSYTHLDVYKRQRPRRPRRARRKSWQTARRRRWPRAPIP